MHIQACRIFSFFYLIFFQFSVASSVETNIKVAVVHFHPYLQQVSYNIDRLLQLAEEAGSNGAKIVVFPEMATSGYSYFNREQIRQVAETIPGKTTELFSPVAKKHGMVCPNMTVFSIYFTMLLFYKSRR